MITWLDIKNLALVERAEIEFDAGFNAITGETGAGKSVIIGAIALLLGERAGKELIRRGADACEITAEFVLPPDSITGIAVILDAAGIAPEPSDRLQIRRRVTASSSRNFINDTPVTIKTLKLIGDKLVDIHGAGEHQSLLKPSTRLTLLDRFGGLRDTVESCAAKHAELKAIEMRRQEMEAAMPSTIEAEHLRLTAAEIDQAAPFPGEDSALTAKHRLAANAREILEVADKAVNALSEGDDSVVERLGEVFRTVRGLAGFDGFDPICARLENLSEEAREIAYDLERQTGGIDLDERAFAEMESRMSIIETMKRRYGPTIEKVLETRDEARRRLGEYDSADELRLRVAADLAAVEKELREIAGELSGKRRAVAGRFSKEVECELRKLGFGRAVFKVEVNSGERIGGDGADEVEFLFSANAGETPLPLRKVASSGEISRVMLAVKRVLAAADTVPILIFDEIDANIGGETAVVVGNELAELGRSHQVLAISHLAQVAAAAARHFMVDKQETAARSATKIRLLNTRERGDELARMLGGGQAALEHASSLLRKKTPDEAAVRPISKL